MDQSYFQAIKVAAVLFAPCSKFRERQAVHFHQTRHCQPDTLTRLTGAGLPGWGLSLSDVSRTPVESCFSGTIL